MTHDAQSNNGAQVPEPVFCTACGCFLFEAEWVVPGLEAFCGRACAGLSPTDNIGKLREVNG